MPPVQADRVQVQQVLVNLLVNAIEPIGKTRRRTRRITIRSAPVDGRDGATFHLQLPYSNGAPASHFA